MRDCLHVDLIEGLFDLVEGTDVAGYHPLQECREKRRCVEKPDFALIVPWDGEAFWLVPSPGAEWAEYVRRNPRVSLAVSESTPPLRRVMARGPIQAVSDPGASQWRSVEGRLAARYARLDAARMLEGRHGQPRVLLRLVPERLIAWRGLLRPAAVASGHTLRSASLG